MPVFDFLYRLDELIADLDFFVPSEPPLYLRWITTPPEDVTPAALEALCAIDEDRWFHTGMLLLQQRKAALCEHCLRRLVALNPARWTDELSLLVNLGTALAMQQQFEEATRLTTRAVQQAPRHAQIRKAHIRVLEQAQRPLQEILEQVRRALELAPEDEELQEKVEQLETQLAP